MIVDNLSAVLYAKDDLRMEKRAIPKARPGQLLVRVHTVGICGSDVHYWKRGAIGPYIVKAPMVVGHETSGCVEEVGENVNGFEKGDRVALEPGIPCRRCLHCKTGSYNLCPDMEFFATPPVHGSLARYVVHDADFCYKLPDNVSYEEGALVEPLSVAVHTCRRAGVTVGQRVLVAGADIDEGRLELAKKIGALHTINVRSLSPSEVKEAIINALGQAPDVSIECTGAESSIETAILTTRSGGVLVLVGLGADKANLPIVDAALREVDIRGVFRYANCYPTAIELIASGRIDLSSLTRAHYKLEDTLQAFERTLKADVVKVFIGCE